MTGGDDHSSAAAGPADPGAAAAEAAAGTGPAGEPVEEIRGLDQTAVADSAVGQVSMLMKKKVRAGWSDRFVRLSTATNRCVLRACPSNHFPCVRRRNPAPDLSKLLSVLHLP